MLKSMLTFLLNGTACALFVPFANSHIGAKLFVCATAQATVPANAAAYAALTWVEVGGVGNHGETGTNTNILTYDVWSTGFSDKSKGVSNAGDPEIEVARDSADGGQDILRTIAATNLKYAFKIEMNDKLTGGGTNTIRYNYGIIVGPRVPNGRGEDFDLEVFTLGLVARETVVDPT